MRPASRAAPAVALLWSMILASCASEQLTPAERASDTQTAAAVGDDSTLSLRPATVEDVLAVVRSPGPRATVVNVWATWCIPCREEFPELMQIHATYRDSGLRLVLVSADFDDQQQDAIEFLTAQGVRFPTYLKQGDDMKFIDAMNPGWTGALPATLVYDAAGTLRYFHEGRFSRPELEAAVVEALHSPHTVTGG